MSNCITNYIDLPLNTLINVNFLKPSIIDGCSTSIIKADTIRKDFYNCSHCGSIHKHTMKEYINIFNKYSILDNHLIILNVKKRRFVCHDCNSTFTETIPNIKPRARISELLNKRIANEFITSKTNKDVAIKTFVSQSTVSRRSKFMEQHIDNINYNYLPSAIGFDEFKATKDSMAFILISHIDSKPIDILPSRKSYHLRNYFSKFSQHALDNVKTITMDMYDPYISIAKEFFKNATIVFDKFHVVQNFTRALNKTRINFMNTLSSNSIEYKRLKHYWKPLLSLNINSSLNNYEYYPKFKNKTNLSDIVHHIKAYDKTLASSYDFYQIFFYHLNNKNFDAAKSIIVSYKDRVSNHMKTAINTFEKYSDYCLEAYTSEYSNALTESIISKIKLIKRNAYGFSNFLSLKRRAMHYFMTRKYRESLTRLPMISNIRHIALSN